MKKRKSKQVFHVLLAVFITALVLRVFVIDSFIVEGDSMAPTLLGSDYVFTNKVSYRFNEPERGDIIVLKPRGLSIRMVKRIVGMPGDWIEIKNGKIIIKKDREDKGEILYEAYINLPGDTPAVGITSIRLDPEEYFVMGDNRYVSIDSRELGPIDKWDIGGKIFLSINFKRAPIISFLK